jgi:hypothetical protein
MKTRNSEVLAAFVAYCKANPSQRFWQALLNWSGCGFIFASGVPLYEIHSDSQASGVIKDTFYWEEKNR